MPDDPVNDPKLEERLRWAEQAKPEPLSATESEELRALVGSFVGTPELIGKLDDGSLRALSSVLLERMMFARQAGISFHGHRDVYEILGYNRVLTYREYRATYVRGGIAKRIVDAYPVAVWRGGAEVYEDEKPEIETEFEKAWKSLDERLGVWSRFQRVNILSSLSTYAILLIGDGEPDLSQPLKRGNGSPDGVVYLQPFSGGGGPGGGDQQDNRSRAMNADASIAEFDQDATSARFGQPLFYNLKRTDVNAPLLQRRVHWTRVIHVAEGLLGDEVYGTPALEAVWNYLDDLMKVVGGGAEAFWLRANRMLHADVDKTMGAPVKLPGVGGTQGLDRDERKELREKVDELQHQLNSSIVTRGVNLTPITSPVADFKSQADAIVTLIAGTKAIPKRILVGSEMGQLASGQDKDNWNTQVQDKRTSWAFPSLVKPFVDRLVEFGYLPKPKEFHVEWPLIEDLTEDEKVKLTLDMANVNKTQESVVYTEDEMRAVTRREPIADKVESDQLSEMQKAEVAAKLALTNKEQGVTVFTDDEIRRVSYGFQPLTPEQKVPIGAPEKISVTAPPKQDDQVPMDEGQLLAASVRQLEAAIERNDVAEIARIVGASMPEPRQRIKTIHYADVDGHMRPASIVEEEL